MTTTQLSTDSQAIALACSGLALADERSLKPLTASEWQRLCGALVRSTWGRPGELLGRGPAELRQELGIAADTAERLSLLLRRGGQLAFEVDRLASRGIWVLTRADEAYPQRLKKLLGAQAPPLLYGAGPREALHAPALAVIGSRDADPTAVAFARELGRHCARRRVAIVSGAARGVNVEAMTGALEAGGIAVGVTVDPLERLVRRPALRAAIGEDSLTLVTPYHPSTRWHVGNAMGRNRLVYAMSQAAVVVATAAKSGGTWAGAIENIKHHWVPVYVRANGDAGSRELTLAGAHPLSPGPVEEIDVQSLFDEPPPTVAPGSPDQPEPVGTSDAFWAVWPLLNACLHEPHSERDVAEALRLQPTQARIWLTRAVNEGLVKVKKRPRKVYMAGDVERDQLTLG